MVTELNVPRIPVRTAAAVLMSFPPERSLPRGAVV